MTTPHKHKILIDMWSAGLPEGARIERKGEKDWCLASPCNWYQSTEYRIITPDGTIYYSDGQIKKANQKVKRWQWIVTSNDQPMLTSKFYCTEEDVETTLIYNRIIGPALWTEFEFEE